MRIKVITLFILCAFTLTLAAQTERGELLEASDLGNISSATITTFISFLEPSLAGDTQYDVELKKTTYGTLNQASEIDLASGLMAVPDPANLAPDQTVPILIYLHGTASNREAVPSRVNPQSLDPTSEGFLVSFLASLGFAVVAPDYIGLGDSPGNHPYVHAATEGSAGVDLLQALKAWASANDYPLNTDLYITGYSQGGHAAAAVHQIVERDYPNEYNLVAGSFMSGPYSISEVMSDLMTGEEEYVRVSYLPNTIIGYNLIYQIYPGLENFLKEPYLSMSQAYADEQTNLTDLNNDLTDTLILKTGGAVPKRMLHDSIISFINGEEDHPIKQALRENDLDNWVPIAPVRLVYCQGDDQVDFENALTAEEKMNDLGAQNVLAVQVDTEDNQLIHTDCVVPAATYTAKWFLELLNQSTSIQSVKPAITGLEIQPNPVNQWATLKNLAINSKISLVNIQGQQVGQWEVSSRTMQLNLAAYPAGIYSIMVQSAKTMQVGKIIKK